MRQTISKRDEARIGRRVRILGGMKEFVGQTGVIREVEPGPAMFRVRLDQPLEIPHVGLVTDDLWQGSYLRTLRD